MSLNSKRCWQPGCSAKGIKCFDLRENDGPARYCSEHAAENGFCYCGVFHAGNERFEFGPYAGLCDNCANQAETEDSWADDWDTDPDSIDIYAAEY